MSRKDGANWTCADCGGGGQENDSGQFQRPNSDQTGSDDSFNDTSIDGHLIEDGDKLKRLELRFCKLTKNMFQLQKGMWGMQKKMQKTDKSMRDVAKKMKGHGETVMDVENRIKSFESSLRAREVEVKMRRKAAERWTEEMRKDREWVENTMAEEMREEEEGGKEHKERGIRKRLEIRRSLRRAKSRGRQGSMERNINKNRIQTVDRRSRGEDKADEREVDSEKNKCYPERIIKKEDQTLTKRGGVVKDKTCLDEMREIDEEKRSVGGRAIQDNRCLDNKRIGKGRSISGERRKTEKKTNFSDTRSKLKSVGIENRKGEINWSEREISVKSSTMRGREIMGERGNEEDMYGNNREEERRADEREEASVQNAKEDAASSHASGNTVSDCSSLKTEESLNVDPRLFPIHLTPASTHLHSSSFVGSCQSEPPCNIPTVSVSSSIPSCFPDSFLSYRSVSNGNLSVSSSSLRRHLSASFHSTKSATHLSSRSAKSNLMPQNTYRTPVSQTHVDRCYSILECLIDPPDEFRTDPEFSAEVQKCISSLSIALSKSHSNLSRSSAAILSRCKTSDYLCPQSIDQQDSIHHIVSGHSSFYERSFDTPNMFYSSVTDKNMKKSSVSGKSSFKSSSISSLTTKPFPINDSSNHRYPTSNPVKGLDFKSQPKSKFLRSTPLPRLSESCNRRRSSVSTTNTSFAYQSQHLPSNRRYVSNPSLPKPCNRSSSRITKSKSPDPTPNSSIHTKTRDNILLQSSSSVRKSKSIHIVLPPIDTQPKISRVGNSSFPCKITPSGHGSIRYDSPNQSTINSCKVAKRKSQPPSHARSSPSTQPSPRKPCLEKPKRLKKLSSRFSKVLSQRSKLPNHSTQKPISRNTSFRKNKKLHTCATTRKKGPRTVQSTTQTSESLFNSSEKTPNSISDSQTDDSKNNQIDYTTPKHVPRSEPPKDVAYISPSRSPGLLSIPEPAPVTCYTDRSPLTSPPPLARPGFSYAAARTSALSPPYPSERSNSPSPPADAAFTPEGAPIVFLNRPPQVPGSVTYPKGTRASLSPRSISPPPLLNFTDPSNFRNMSNRSEETQVPDFVSPCDSRIPCTERPIGKMQPKSGSQMLKVAAFIQNDSLAETSKSPFRSETGTQFPVDRRMLKPVDSTSHGPRPVISISKAQLNAKNGLHFSCAQKQRTNDSNPLVSRTENAIGRNQFNSNHGAPCPCVKNTLKSVISVPSVLDSEISICKTQTNSKNGGQCPCVKNILKTTASVQDDTYTENSISKTQINSRNGFQCPCVKQPLKTTTSVPGVSSPENLIFKTQLNSRNGFPCPCAKQPLKSTISVAGVSSSDNPICKTQLNSKTGSSYIGANRLLRTSKALPDVPSSEISICKTQLNSKNRSPCPCMRNRLKTVTSVPGFPSTDICINKKRLTSKNESLNRCVKHDIKSSTSVPGVSCTGNSICPNQLSSVPGDVCPCEKRLDKLEDVSLGIPNTETPMCNTRFEAGSQRRSPRLRRLMKPCDRFPQFDSSESQSCANDGPPSCPSLVYLGKLGSWNVACRYPERHRSVSCTAALSSIDKSSSGKHMAMLGKILMTSAHKGRAGDVQKLLDMGAPVNFTNTIKWTPLHRAVAKAHEDVVELLLRRGADANARTSYGLTPLHFAACSDRSGHTIIRLVCGGADVNVWNRCGQTPLHTAAARGNVAGVAALVEAGAPLVAKDNEGRTPYDAAKSTCVRRLLTGNIRVPRQRLSLNKSSLDLGSSTENGGSCAGGCQSPFGTEVSTICLDLHHLFSE